MPRNEERFNDSPSFQSAWREYWRAGAPDDQDKVTETSYPGKPSRPPAPLTVSQFLDPPQRRQSRWSIGASLATGILTVFCAYLVIVTNQVSLAQLGYQTAISVTATPSHVPVQNSPTRLPLGSPTSFPGIPSSPTGTATQSGLLTVTITCLALIDKHTAQLCVRTIARAGLSIQVIDCDGTNDSKAPPAGSANEQGRYVATWKARKPHGGCTTAKVAIVAVSAGKTAKASGTLDLSGVV